MSHDANPPNPPGAEASDSEPDKKPGKKQITSEKLNRKDYYRPQVHLADPMTWAAGYNAIAEFDPELAARVRDAFAVSAEQLCLECLKTLFATKEFRDFYHEWVKNTAKVQEDKDAYAAFCKWTNKHGFKRQRKRRREKQS